MFRCVHLAYECVLKSQRLSSWYWHSSSSAYDTFALNWIFVFRVDSLQFCKHNIRWCLSVQHINNYADRQYSNRSHLKGCVLCINRNTIKSIRNARNQLFWEEKKNCFVFVIVYFFSSSSLWLNCVNCNIVYGWMKLCGFSFIKIWSIFCGYN